MDAEDAGLDPCRLSPPGPRRGAEDEDMGDRRPGPSSLEAPQ